MDFDFTSDQLHLRKAVREFAESEIRPHVMEWDEAQIFPLEVIKHLGELGYMGSIFPEELGGAGLGYIDYSIIIEELARVDGSVGIIVAAHTSLSSNHIYKSGTDEQRRRYIPKLATGEWIGCWSLTEPEAGSDAAGTRTTAVRDGDCWVLNGSKTFTTNAHYADVCVAMAVTNRAGAQHGISAFNIEKGTPGFRAGKKENKLGLRASATGEVIFDNCRLPATQLPGKEGEGFMDSLKVLDGGRVSIAALSIGMAQGAYDAALQYSKQRQQFGRPISEFQAIQHKLVDMATAIRRFAPAQLPRRLDARPRPARDQGIFHGLKHPEHLGQPQHACNPPRLPSYSPCHLFGHRSDPVTPRQKGILSTQLSGALKLVSSTASRPKPAVRRALLELRMLRQAAQQHRAPLPGTLMGRPMG